MSYKTVGWAQSSVRPLPPLIYFHTSGTRAPAQYRRLNAAPTSRTGLPHLLCPSTVRKRTRRDRAQGAFCLTTACNGFTARTDSYGAWISAGYTNHRGGH